MKKFYVKIVTLTICCSCWGQNKSVSLEDIWQKYSFYPEYVWGLKSMNNGCLLYTSDAADDP